MASVLMLISNPIGEKSDLECITNFNTLWKKEFCSILQNKQFKYDQIYIFIKGFLMTGYFYILLILILMAENGKHNLNSFPTNKIHIFRIISEH